MSMVLELALRSCLGLALLLANSDGPEGRGERGAGGLHDEAVADEPAAGTALPKGVVLHLSFDEQTLCRHGDELRAADVSGQGRWATLRGPLPAIGRHGSALSFDGLDDLLTGADVALPQGSEPSTVSLWFMPRRGGFQGLFAYGSKSTSSARGIAVHPARFVCYYRWIEPACDYRLELALNEWHHLAVVFDGARSRLYVNGEFKGEDQKEFDTVRERFVAGCLLDESQPFDGLLDELIVFDRALEAAEIQSLFERAPSPARAAPDPANLKACPPGEQADQ